METLAESLERTGFIHEIAEHIGAVTPLTAASLTASAIIIERAIDELLPHIPRSSRADRLEVIEAVAPVLIVE